ncbi:MAG: tetratricopeptide repeat protein [Candidatus Anstonellales archaeon]
MEGSIKVETCPQCDAPVKVGTNKCAYCEAEFLVTSLAYLDRFDKSGINKYINHYKQLLKDDPNNGEINCAMGICYLDLGLYDLASKYFAKAIEQIPDYADAYYYYALALLKGKRPKVLTLTEIRKIEEYINAAIQIDNSKSKYYYLLALIKHDFYIKNGLKINPPSFEELICQANSLLYDRNEINKMLQRVPTNDQYLMNLVMKGGDEK